MKSRSKNKRLSSTNLSAIRKGPSLNTPANRATKQSGTSAVKPQRPLCTCIKPQGSKSELHQFGKHESLQPLQHSAFLSLPITGLNNLVQQQQFELESSTARFWLTLKERLRQIHEREQRKAKAEEEERQRELAILRAAEEAKQRAAGFLTFRYRRSVEERSRIGPWPPYQLIGFKAVQTPDLDLSLRSVGPKSNKISHDVPLYQTNSTAGPQINNSINAPTPFTIIEPKESQISLTTTPCSLDESRRSSLRSHPTQTPQTPLTPNTPSEMSLQPVRNTTGGVDSSIKDVIQHLFMLQQNVSAFRIENQSSLNNRVEEVARALVKLEDQVSQPNHPLQNVRIAPEIIEYVDDGRNPDIFTRDFVELVQRGNSVVNGKQKAFRDYSRIFAKALKDNFDGMDDEVDAIMDDAGMQVKDGKFVDKGRANGNIS